MTCCTSRPRRTRATGSLEAPGQLGIDEGVGGRATYVLAHAEKLGIPLDVLHDKNVHIHVPAGAVPKDGPSAGVTMTTTLASLLSGRLVRDDVAMTGEATLRGRVLPVGGIQSKVLAAHRHGLGGTVILPKRNAQDLDDVPQEIRDEMTFVPVETMDEVLATALVDAERASVAA
ncbi:MAG: S16 family serine protease [Myxococcota bacterium]